MSEGCTYTHDISGELFDDRDGTEWNCPHDAVEDGLCRFHASTGLVDTERVRERLIELVESKRGRVDLIGARLRRLDLDYAVLDGPSNHPIDLREATIGETLSARHATIDRPLHLEGTTLSGGVNFEGARVRRRVDLGEATFGGPVTLRLADFESWLDVRSATFEKRLHSRVVEFEHGIFAEDAIFEAAADFTNAHFQDTANFHGATFRSGAVFNSAVFESSLNMSKALIKGPAINLGQTAGGSLSRTAGTHDGVALSIHAIHCNRYLRLRGARLDANVDVAEAELGKDMETLEIEVVDVGDAKDKSSKTLEASDNSTGSERENGVVIDCTRTSILSGDLSSAGGRITYDVSEAELGEVDIADDSSFEMFRFSATRFRGFDFGAYRQTLADRDWRLHDPQQEDQLSPEHLEETYLRAKNGAKEIGETRIASEFFIKEMQYRRSGHGREIADGDLRAVFRWVGNLGLQGTSGYGERPFRPFVFSVGVVLLFGLGFWELQPTLAYSQPFGYFIFSGEAFVSVILGIPRTAGAMVSFLVVLEAFLGAFAIGLFVFALTRAVSR